MKNSLQTISTILFTLLLTACATNPAAKLDALALDLNLEKEILSLSPIALAIFYSKNRLKPIRTLNSKTLNIYIEGDGSVLSQLLFSSRKPTKNPTSRSPVALSLMGLDKNPSVYLSRPCYAIEPLPANCTSDWWTDKRYSEDVIYLMNQALDSIKKKFGVNAFTLIGHSGGGVVAMILAGTRSDINNIITVASNIDHDLWTRSLGFKKLAGSLNAADYLPLAENIRQLHLVGEKDRVVPSYITRQALSKDTNAQVQSFAEFTHTCCWNTVWQDVINSIQN